MDLRLDGKKAFVSGSTQGIGHAVARALAQEGSTVVLNGRNQARLDAAVRQLKMDVPGAVVSGLRCDFAAADQVERLLSGLGDVDILVNNVGLFDQQPFSEITDADWQHYLEVNLMSGVRLSRHLLDEMVQRGWGRIIFIGSESGVNVPGDMLRYGVTKAATLALSNGLAKLTRGTEVTVNTILGGPTLSDGVADTIGRIAEAQSVPAADLETAIIAGNRTSLLERFIDPAEIAHLAAYLASPLSSATNGAAVRADGGVLTAML